MRSRTLIRAETADIEAAFDEWMRRFIEEPERFAREFQSVIQFNQGEAAGRKPSYGEDCTEYLKQLLAEGRPAA